MDQPPGPPPNVQVIKKECIPVGCIPPTCCPYLLAYTAHRGSTWSWGVPGPGGCTWSQGEGYLLGCTYPGVYLPRGCTWSQVYLQGEYLVPGGVNVWDAYLVLGGTWSGLHLPGGVYLPRGIPAHVLPPVKRMTDRHV